MEKNKLTKKQNAKGEILLYEKKKGQINMEVYLENETVWLDQSQMAKLFKKDVNTIGEHISNLFKEKELSRKSTTRKFRVVQKV